MLADMKGYKFIVHLENFVHGNKMYLLKAIKNLLDNAFHYALSWRKFFNDSKWSVND